MSAADTIAVTVRFLARYAEVAGREGVSVRIPARSTVASLLAALRAEHRALGTLPANPLCALNFRQVRGDQILADGDELALLPPMAGG